MQVEQILAEFLDGKTDNIEIVINELSLYIAKVFYKTHMFDSLDEIKSELYIFLVQKKSSFATYNQPRWGVVKRSAINYFKDVLKKKRVQLLDMQESDLSDLIDKTTLYHTELSYIIKLSATEKFESFKKTFTEKEKLILLDLLDKTKLNFASKQAEYKAKERLKKKLKDTIFNLNLDYETADLLLDLFWKNTMSNDYKNIVSKTKTKGEKK